MQVCPGDVGLFSAPWKDCNCSAQLMESIQKKTVENCTGSHRAAVPGSGWEEAGSKEKEGCEQEDSLPVIRRGVKRPGACGPGGAKEGAGRQPVISLPISTSLPARPILVKDSKGFRRLLMIIDSCVDNVVSK